MTRLRFLTVALIAAALIARAVEPVPHHADTTADGYHILSGDFHVHSFPGDFADLAPWDEILEARRSHLDVIALASHNHVWSGKLGAWMASKWGGPIVLPGEEIVGPAPHYHLLAIGIHSTIDWRDSAAEAINAIHAQGGVAIAAHPVSLYWSSYDAAALKRLDGAEILHPLVYEPEHGNSELHQFFARGSYAAIGDSDYRGLGTAGVCRTYIFARERTASAVLDSVREKRTVVYDQGEYYGDPALIKLLQTTPGVIEPDNARRSKAWSVYFSAIVGGLGLLLLIIAGPIGFGRDTA